MANFVAYIGLIVGLSLLFAMAGMPNTTHSLIDRFMTITSNSPTGQFSIDPSGFNKDGKALLASIFGISATLLAAIAIKSAAGGTFGIAESLKIGALATLMGLIMADLYGLFIFVNSVNDFSGVTKALAFLIYVPIAIMAVISAIDWIGGGR